LRNLLAILLSLFFFIVKGQPPICGPDGKMESTCIQACIICDINGFTGINNSNVRGEAPSDFCTSQVHHMQWLAFIAGTPNLKIEVSVFNCRQNNGLEVGIYEGIDCKNYKKMSDCNTDIPPNTKWVFTNSSPLTVGQYYYWVMDGSNNDVCSYTIKVLEGSTKVAPLTKAPDILTPNVVCQNVPTKLSTPGLIGATIYDWFVDNVRVGSGFDLEYKFSEAKEYEVCLNAKNACSSAPRGCMKIKVLPLSQTVIKQEVCFDECYNFLGKDYCKTDKYEFVFKAKNGCDSIVVLDLVVNDQISIDRTVKICEGDTLTLGTGKHWRAGPQVGFIQDADGCKIKVNLNLELIKCNIKTAGLVTKIKCNNEKNGAIDFSVTNGSPPITYSWYKLENPSVKGGGLITLEKTAYRIPNLDEGNYVFEVKDTFGNVAVKNIFVSQPKRLRSEIVKSTFKGGVNVSCNGSKDGAVEIIPTGGTSPFTIQWASGSPFFKLKDLAGGKYPYTQRDTNGCLFIDTVVLTEPAPLKANALFQKSGCISPSSGIINLRNTNGGTKPYEIRINDILTTTSYLDTLSKGDYNVSIMDANACTTDTIITILDSAIPLISLDSLYKVNLGDSILIALMTNNLEQKIAWDPADYLSCKDCKQVSSFPLYTKDYVISSTSKDGCIRTAKTKVEVIKNYDFILSNVITPNNDVINDHPRYYTDNSVEVVEELAIYDRWGSLYYNITNTPKGMNDLILSDARHGKKIFEDGVYVWSAKVKYIDGETRKHYGTLTVLK
jgi:hypothetical protein